MCPKDNFGNYKIKHGIAEKLETFVVVARGAAVSQRLLKQPNIVELVIQRVLEPYLGFV